MAKFDHEKLDVYSKSLEFVQFANSVGKAIPADQRHMRDQLLRAATSIPLNIAEGNGKLSFADRRRFFEIARGSAMECAAALDILVACEVLSAAQIAGGKEHLVRIVSMLMGLANTRSSRVREESADYDNDEDKDEDEGFRDPYTIEKNSE